MKPSRLPLLIVVVILSTIACATPPNQTSINGPGASPPSTNARPDQFANARAIFLRDCVACHGEKGEGGTVKIEDKTLRVPSLREGHALKHPDSEFVAQITEGGDGMPAFKDKLKPEEMNELARFIRQEFQGGITPPPESTKTTSKH